MLIFTNIFHINNNFQTQSASFYFGGLLAGKYIKRVCELNVTVLQCALKTAVVIVLFYFIV